MDFTEVVGRIKNKTIEKDGHWLFQGTRPKGYGQIRFQGKMVNIHRLSAACYLGLDMDDRTKQANHKIECRHKNCWNPEHLYIGTESENKADRFHKDEEHLGNQYTRATHCIHGHEFTEENTYDYGHGRKCRQCEKDRYNASRGR
jgi:hypothetical protein